MRPQIVGIVNITEDSFSDGGKFLALDQAIAQGETLMAQGADWLDLGAESSNPDGAKVSAALEIERLTPVIQHFRQRGVKIAVDVYKPEVIEAVLELGVGMINDITALRNPQSIEVLKHSDVPIVLMFARNQLPRAERQVQPHQDLIPEITNFFTTRIQDLAAQGIQRERLILDPGMGFFLGSNPEPSLWVLRHLQEFRSLGLPLYVSTSRKSFIGTILNQPPQGRGIGTLVTEIWAMHQGVAYLRTHEVAPLHQARTLWQAIETIE